LLRFFKNAGDKVMDNKKVQPTEHPHTVKILGASGIWQAAIKGTYIRVWALIGCHKRGMDEWEILKSFPTITAAQLHDALSYYHDHKSEIEDFIEANERAYDEYLTEEL
jgi:uncharacterized protein (DUF433 family)